MSEAGRGASVPEGGTGGARSADSAAIPRDGGAGLGSAAVGTCDGGAGASGPGAGASDKAAAVADSAAAVSNRTVAVSDRTAAVPNSIGAVAGSDAEVTNTAAGTLGPEAVPSSPAVLPRLRLLADSVMFSHTLFSLPFVLAALLLAGDGRPDPLKLLWIVLAATGARNAANALNRLVDQPFDAANPRTAGRHLPAGTVRRRELWWLSALMVLLFIGATAMLNLLCLALLPVALAFIVVYSYTKRFTWLCHFVLGFTCSMATMGAFLALSGHFELRYFVLMLPVALWVAGFDILYACQDIDFDRSARLHSVPARFGAKAARRLAGLCHLATLAGFALLPLFWPLGWIYAAGWLAVAGLLVAEQILGRSERHIRLASYGINQIVAVVFLLAVAADIWLGLAMGWPESGQVREGLLGRGMFPASPDWGRLFARDLLDSGFWQQLGQLTGIRP